MLQSTFYHPVLQCKKGVGEFWTNKKVSNANSSPLSTLILSLSRFPFLILCASFRAHVCTRDFRVTILDFIVISLPRSVPFFSLCFPFFFFTCLERDGKQSLFCRKKKTRAASKNVGRVGGRGVGVVFFICRIICE